jgi:hypothetical protein
MFFAQRRKPPGRVKFLFAALIALLLLALTWLVAELREVKTLAKWILGVVAVMILAAFAAPIVGGFWWWSFG